MKLDLALSTLNWPFVLQIFFIVKQPVIVLTGPCNILLHTPHPTLTNTFKPDVMPTTKGHCSQGKEVGSSNAAELRKRGKPNSNQLMLSGNIL